MKRAKPDPEIFQLAHQFLSLPKKQVLVLEDSQNGVLAAHRAKLDVVMVPDLIEPTPETKAKTTHILPSLLEVPAFLEM